MIVFWVLEILPVQITSLFPLIFFPIFNIVTVDRICSVYMNSANLVFFGGLCLAIAIEHSKIHQRIALVAIDKIGCSLLRLNFILMLITMFISMWIVNTAACAMMCPICRAIIDELQSEGLIKIFHDKEPNDEEPPKPTDITISMYLGLAYGATIGGVGTLIGTGTNLVYKGIFEGRFPDAPQVDFLKWMLFSVPLMLLMNYLTYLSLQVLYLGYLRPKSEASKKYTLPKESQQIVQRVVGQKLKELGPLTSHEISIFVFFIAAIALFCTRSPGIFVGWADLMPEK